MAAFFLQVGPGGLDSYSESDPAVRLRATVSASALKVLDWPQADYPGRPAGVGCKPERSPLPFLPVSTASSGPGSGIGTCRRMGPRAWA